MPIRVQTPHGIVEFPDGTSEQEMAAALSSLGPADAGEQAARKATGLDSPNGAMVAPGGGRGTQLNVRRSNNWLRENAPTIGATMATLPMGGGGGIIPWALRAAAAGGGGAAGSGLRGDDPSTMAWEGSKQALLQGGGDAVMRGGQAIAHGLMRGTVPENIAKNFDAVDIAQEALNRGAVPGSRRSAARVAQQSSAANVERDAAASSVPPMNPVRTIEGLRPLYQRAKSGGFPDDARTILEEAQKSIRDIKTSPDFAAGGLSGRGVLARKDVMGGQASAALRGSDALTPNMKDAQRASIAAYMRETPRMESALKESQALMALDAVMQKQKNSNLVTRFRSGGVGSAMATPFGLSMSAHAANQGAKLADPQLIRALMALLGERSGQDE